MKGVYMIKNKTCAKCGYLNKIDTAIKEQYLDFLGRPKKEDARNFFDLWHVSFETCENCGFIAKDISESKLSPQEISEELKNAEKLLDDLYVSQDIKDCIIAGMVYEREGSVSEAGKCYLQAWDLIFGAIMHQYVQGEDYDFKNEKEFADELRLRGILLLKTGIDEDFDMDNLLLLTAILLEGNENEHEVAHSIVEQIDETEMTEKQKAMFDYILGAH